MTGKSILLFAAAALAEIGGAYLVWIGLRDNRGPLLVGLGVLALVLIGELAEIDAKRLRLALATAGPLGVAENSLLRPGVYAASGCLSATTLKLVQAEEDWPQPPGSL